MPPARHSPPAATSTHRQPPRGGSHTSRDVKQRLDATKRDKKREGKMNGSQSQRGGQSKREEEKEQEPHQYQQQQQQLDDQIFAAMEASIDRDVPQTESAIAATALSSSSYAAPLAVSSRRTAPPTSTVYEDPLTAFASERTRLVPGSTLPAPPAPARITRDTEPCAPEGSAARFEQRRRVNPLLDPEFITKQDACGLGYGVRHQNHFRYISHWITSEAEQARMRASVELESTKMAKHSGYRSKLGLGYKEEVRGIGFGHPHDSYNRAVSVRRAEDVMKDYPDRQACVKFLHKGFGTY